MPKRHANPDRTVSLSPVQLLLPSEHSHTTKMDALRAKHDPGGQAPSLSYHQPRRRHPNSQAADEAQGSLRPLRPHVGHLGVPRVHKAVRGVPPDQLRHALALTVTPAALWAALAVLSA